MKTLLRQDIPEDFVYYRTGSEVFYEYYKNFTPMNIQIIENSFGFIKGGRILGLPLWSLIAEKIDTEPTRAILKKMGIEHGFVFWAPRRVITKPKGWIRLPSWIARGLLHSSRSGFCILDRADFWEKWSSKARGHRRKILRLSEEGIISLDTGTPGEFLALYQTLHLKDPFQSYIIGWCKKAFSSKVITKNLRVYFARAHGKIVAGAVFIDTGSTSEYFTSFYTEESKPYHMGIAIMNRWLSDSYALGMKYCDLDHMWNIGNPLSQKAYTEFKSSIVEFDVYFEDMWVKMF